MFFHLFWEADELQKTFLGNKTVLTLLDKCNTTVDLVETDMLYDWCND